MADEQALTRVSQNESLAALLGFEAHGAKQLPTVVIESYTGKYDGGKIVVSLEQGQLYFLGTSGLRRRLYALADDTFLIEDTSVPPENQAHVRFVKNAAGSVTELQLLVADGRAFPRAKTLNKAALPLLQQRGESVKSVVGGIQSLASRTGVEPVSPP